MFSENLFDIRANIKVLGVGGAGCNAVNRMIAARVLGVSFVAINTDVQALQTSKAAQRIQIGETVTGGLGSGGDPEVGAAAASESISQLDSLLEGADMVFITAGMGGGTGTGAAPVIAQRSKQKDILTIGVITKPFAFEGGRRASVAEQGANAMREHVDTLITVPNERLVAFAGRKTTMTQAFALADDVLRAGVQGIGEIIIRPGLINVDFADVRSVMANAGAAMMGMGRGRGDNRAKQAAEAAANSPLLENNIEGARRLLVNITSGPDLTIGEVKEAMEYLLQFTHPEESDIIVGHVVREDAEGDVWVTVLAAGLRTAPLSDFAESAPARRRKPEEEAIPGFVSPTAEAQEPVPVGAPPSLDIPTFLRQQRDR